MGERITGHTQLLTLMAYPIRHSNSPAMHNEALAYLGLDYAYLCFDVDQSNLKEAIAAMRTLRVRGGNISMPNKIAVMEYLDVLSPQAQLCGAVNTIVNDDGVLTGHITDGIGYMMALRDKGIDMTGKKMTIVGAGGAGKAIQVQAALDGVGELSIFNAKDGYWQRALDTAAELEEKTNCRVNVYDLADLDALKEQIYDSYLLANATGVGMKPLEGQTYIPDISYFKPGMIVTDVVYAPKETLFLKMAKEAGCETMNGMGMMLFQGAAAFKLWTGQDMPIEHMKKVLDIQ
jgi:shikimate dehydrogenase